jgi:epoxyqueuosine reductase
MIPDTKKLLAKALDLGAFAAGVVSVEMMLQTPSEKYVRKQGLDNLDLGSVGPGQTKAPVWQFKAASLLITALAHPNDQPGLDDWQDGVKGGTRGNQELITINQELKKWLLFYGIEAFDLHYYPEKGGVYLKDAAALAGLGVIGRNNLLLIPGLGASHRLRALALKTEFTPTPGTDYNPCLGCPAPCLRACPEKAFSHQDEKGDSAGGPKGGYNRDLCHLQMQKNLQKPRGAAHAIRFCRNCELVCPEARK